MLLLDVVAVIAAAAAVADVLRRFLYVVVSRSVR
jgi:hypothetical protein